MERELLQFLQDNENKEYVIINDKLLEITRNDDWNGMKIFLQKLHNKNYIEVTDLNLFGATIAGVETNLYTYNLRAKIRYEGKIRLKQIYSELKFDTTEDLQLAILATIAGGKSNMRQTVFETITNQTAFFTLKEDVFTKIWNELKDIGCIKEITNNPREVEINAEKDCLSYYNNLKTKRQEKYEKPVRPDKLNLQQSASSNVNESIDIADDLQSIDTDKKVFFMSKSKNPRLFIGSSREGLKIVNAIVRNLGHDVDCNIWPHAFPLSHNTIDSLLSELNKNDFAAFILSGEDITKMRGEEFATSRDNVIFEAGLAIGKYGKFRCFLVAPTDIEDFHLPTDLLGFTPAYYISERANTDPNNALVSASDQIREAIQANIWNTLKIDIDSRVDSADPSNLRYKNKVFLRFLNRENYSLRIELREVKLRKITVDPVDKIFGKKNYYEPKFITDLGGGREHLYLEHILKPGEQKDVWIPIDPSISRDNLKQIVEKNALGSIQIQIELLNSSDQKIIKNIEF